MKTYLEGIHTFNTRYAMTMYCHPADYLSTDRLTVCHHLQPTETWHWRSRLLSMLGKFCDSRLSFGWTLGLDTPLAI
jgi:hypothetical protein